MQVSAGGGGANLPPEDRGERDAGGVGPAAAGERRSGSGGHAGLQHCTLHQPVHSKMSLFNDGDCGLADFCTT